MSYDLPVEMSEGGAVVKAVFIRCSYCGQSFQPRAELLWVATCPCCNAPVPVR